MIPGEMFIDSGELLLNEARSTIEVPVSNSGERPIQVGSHYHFYETNAALSFDRDSTRGFRLDIPAGTAERFEPGQTRTVTLGEFAGDKEVYGFNQKVMGPLEDKS